MSFRDDPKKGERWWNVKQVAEYLGVSEKTVYRLVKAAIVPGVKIRSTP